MKRYILFTAPIIVLLLVHQAFATDLTIGRIISPPTTVAVGRPVDVKLWVKNINQLDAPSYTVTVDIKKKGLPATVYSHIFNLTNLPKFDSVEITAPTKFTPPDAGEYEMTSRVDFIEDIDHSNDEKKHSFMAMAAPNVGTRIRQFSYFSPASDSLSTMGIIEFTIPPTTKPCFLNVLIRRNDASEPVWIVRNLLYMGPDFTPQNPIGMFIDFKRIGLLPGEILDSAILCVSCTETPLSEPPVPDVTCEYHPVTPDKYVVGMNNIEGAAVTHPDPFIIDSLPTFLSTPSLTDTVERGCTMPNIELDSSAHPGTAAGYKGDWNACVPAGIANSMEWLEKSNPGLMNTGLSLREKLEEISSFCNRQVNGATPSYRDMIQAKLAFIDKYKLPIKVKFQTVWGEAADIPSPDPRYGHKATYAGAAGAELTSLRSPQWNWLVQEMKDSEDVEMTIGWYDTTGQRKGGHCITVTGTAVINGQKQFRFKDDQHQGVAGGTRMPSVFWHLRDDGWVYVSDLSPAGRSCFIEGLASESFDTSVKFIESGVNEILRGKDVLLTLAKNPTERGEEVPIDVFIAAAGKYRLFLADIAGREFVTLAEGYFDEGAKRYYWDGTINGLQAPAGIYLLSVVGKGRQEVVKIVRY